jgi:hypothetical protein
VRTVRSRPRQSSPLAAAKAIPAHPWPNVPPVNFSCDSASFSALRFAAGAYRRIQSSPSSPTESAALLIFFLSLRATWS